MTLPIEAESSPQAVGDETWSAVGSMAMCVALLIAAEFMPVSLLTPIADDLHATVGMAGQAISISGLFAVVTSLLIATVAARFDRRHVLIVASVVVGTGRHLRPDAGVAQPVDAVIAAPVFH